MCARATPNDLKLSDRRLGRDACAAGGKAAAEAGGVTETPVRSSAWLGHLTLEGSSSDEGNAFRLTDAVRNLKSVLEKGKVFRMWKDEGGFFCAQVGEEGKTFINDKGVILPLYVSTEDHLTSSV